MGVLKSVNEVTLDPGPLADLRDIEAAGETGLLKGLIEDFKSNSQTLLAQIEDAIRSGNRQGVEFAAHSLKSSSVVLGGKQLAEAAYQFESGETQGEGELQDLENLRRLCQITIAALESLK